MENKQTLAEKAVEQIAQEAAKKGQGKVDLERRKRRRKARGKWTLTRSQRQC